MPRWFIAPRAWRDYRRHLLNRSCLIRIAAASMAAYLCMAMFCKWLLPNVILPNALELIAVVLQFCLMIFALQFIHILIPPCIVIRPEKIVYQTGQTPYIIECESISKSIITVHAENRVVLRICHINKKGKHRVIAVAIKPSIDLDRLSELLPQLPIIRDARSRHNWKLSSSDDRECA